MTIAVVGTLTALILTITAGAQIIRALIRQHARERDLLIDKIMHLADRTWTPPPAETAAYVDPAEGDLQGERFTDSPAHMADFYGGDT